VTSTTLSHQLSQFSFETVKVNDRGQIIQKEQKTAQFYQETLPGNVALDMVYITGGTFWMGTEDREIERLCKLYSTDWFKREKPRIQVTIQPFFMGKFALTQQQYQAIMGENPSSFKQGNNYPVESVSWHDAMEFCQKLSAKTGKTYTLPSESQWEYACRAMPSTPLPNGEGSIYPLFYFGETITPDLVNYDGNYPYGNAAKGKYRKKTTSVDYFHPNNFGLYNMHGNVWEWCLDDWEDNYHNKPNDGSPCLILYKNDSNIKVLRGVSWNYYAWDCRSAARFGNSPAVRFNYIGFRLVCGGAGL
jgi:formylglycine-generating enzyme required for sulfatase activity